MKAKNLLWLILIAIALFFLAYFTSGCADDPTVNIVNPVKTKTHLVYPMGMSTVSEITYDGCQYIFINWGNASWGAHKGNCNNPIHQYKIEKE